MNFYTHLVAPSGSTHRTVLDAYVWMPYRLWQVSEWQSPVVYAPLALVERLLRWRHDPSTQPRVLVAEQFEQVKRLSTAHPPEVTQVLAMKEHRMWTRRWNI